MREGVERPLRHERSDAGAPLGPHVLESIREELERVVHVQEMDARLSGGLVSAINSFCAMNDAGFGTRMVAGAVTGTEPPARRSST